MEYIKIASVGDIKEGSIKAFSLNGKKIAVGRAEGKYFAVDDVCSHAQCLFSENGFVEGTDLVCGCHGAKFDTATGKVLALPAVKDISSYQVKIKGNDIIIAV